MRGVIQRLVSDDPFDILIAESIFMAGYLDLVPRGVPLIIDTHNIDSVMYNRYLTTLSPGPRRWYTAATVRRIAALEARTLQGASVVWVCSDVERELAQRIAPGCRALTVPNGVDTGSFTPRPDANVVANQLLFFGRLDYYPNSDGLAFFAREILPLVRVARPDVVLHVVGTGASRDVLALAEAEPAIRLVGRVGDPRDALASAAVVVVPLRVGGGTRLKILEALSMARPVVTTSIGAEGLPVEHERHLLRADTAQDFATAIVSLLADRALAERLGAQGRALVRDGFDWTQVHRLVTESLNELIGAPHR
jgi:glycosyltransferase involved in cell wall biosynthesis